MTVDKLNSLDTYEAAKFYDSFGIQLVSVPRKGKHKDPDKKKWQLTSFGLKDFTDPVNIGGKTGSELLKIKDAFFCDVDVDLKLADRKTAFPGASELVEQFLPYSGLIFGRQTAPRMHFVFLTSEPFTTTQFHGVDDKMLIEARSLTKGSKTKAPAVQHSVLPPGIHYTGEAITFDHFDAVTFARTVAPNELLPLVRFAAVGLLMLQV